MAKPSSSGRNSSLVDRALKSAPWVLRFTEHADKTGPVLVVKEKEQILNRDAAPTLDGPSYRTEMHERGLLYGPALVRCQSVLRDLLSRVHDAQGMPLDLHEVLNAHRIEFRGNLPLDEECGVKISLIFKLTERVQDLDRVELIALRVARFTREEASYWLSRINHYGKTNSFWALAGLRIILAGSPKDPAIEEMLEDLRK